MLFNGQCLEPVKELDGETVSKMGIKLLKEVIKSYCLNQWTPWLGIVFIAKKWWAISPWECTEDKAISFAYACTCQTQTQDRGFRLDLCEFPHGRTSLNCVFTLGKLISIISRDE